MDRRAIVFEARRSGYSIGQLETYDRPMTVGELREILEGFDDDTWFVLSHDNGYTYGSISDCRYYTENEDGDWEREW